MRLKFLFINAIDPSREVETRYPPLGIGYLAASLRGRFGEDAIEFRVVDSDIEDEIITFKPDIAGISSVTQNYNKAIAYSKIAKRHGLSVVCGGVHISMLPSTLTKEMDVGVIGEGEDTVCELVDLFVRKGSFDKGELGRVRGIIYWDEGGSLTATPRRDLIYPLDRIPFPARDLFDPPYKSPGFNPGMEGMAFQRGREPQPRRRRRQGRGGSTIKPSTYMFTSRGCPYRCAFCASSRYWDKVRFFSAEYVANEIEYLVKKYNAAEISFQDDLFMYDMERIRRIISLLKQRYLLGKVAFSGAARASLVNEEVTGVLKDLGVKLIGMGLESGCDRTLKYLKGEAASVKANEDAVRIIRKHGIAVSGSFIIGSPQEERGDVLETLRFIKRNRMDSFDAYVLTPFPGTPVWDYALSRGLVSDDMNWDLLNVNFEDNYNSAIILSEKLSRKEIVGLFSLFTRHRKMRSIYNLIAAGLHHPLKVPPFLIRKIAQKIRG